MGTPTTNFGWDKPTIGSDNDIWGDELNGNLDDQDSLFRRFMNSFISASAPAEGQTGTVWLDSTINPYPLKIYDGANWVSMGTLNTVTHVFTPVVTVPTALGSVVQQVFTASGTYTPTTNMAYCIIECVGGGGGAGGVIGSGGFISCSGGGGSGAYSRSRKTAVQVGASQTVTIGTAGSGGAAGNNPGSAGGTTSVGSLVTAPGGGASTGSGSSTNVGAAAPGSGASAGTGDVAVTGNPGQFGLICVGGGPGAGGASYFGGAGIGSVGTQGNGGNATGYGSGGAGANSQSGTSFAGGSGMTGIVIITEFIIAT